LDETHPHPIDGEDGAWSVRWPTRKDGDGRQPPLYTVIKPTGTSRFDIWIGLLPERTYQFQLRTGFPDHRRGGKYSEIKNERVRSYIGTFTTYRYRIPDEPFPPIE